MTGFPASPPAQAKPGDSADVGSHVTAPVHVETVLLDAGVPKALPEGSTRPCCLPALP